MYAILSILETFTTKGEKMTRLKRIVYLSFIIIFTSVLLVGCIPIEYTQGVMLIEDYPIDDFPITEDAVVYYCDKDDDNITIRYGTNEELSAVADFYKAHFENNDITVSDETEKDSRYSAEGVYNNLSFSIKATQASGEYEEKVYTTVVRIKIEFLKPVYETQEKLIGFWRFQRESSQYLGEEMHFIDNDTVIIYNSNYYPEVCTWSAVDENNINITYADGTGERVEISFETNYDKECLNWSSQYVDSTFYRDATRQDMDKMLSDALSSNTWHFVHYMYSYNEINSFSAGNFVFNSDGTFKDDFSNTNDTGTWFISNGFIFCEYDDGESTMTRPIQIEDFGRVLKLFLYDEEDYWLFINKQFNDTTMPEFADKRWYIYSINPDNELLIKCQGHIEFDANHMMSYYRIGDQTTTEGSWYYDGEMMFVFYKDGTMIWYVDVKTDAKGNQNLTLHGPIGYEDLSGFTITDKSLINYVRDTETMTSLLTVGPWQSDHYCNNDGLASYMPDSAIQFHTDGTFTETLQDETLSGTWRFNDGTLRMKYTSGKTEKYPDTYLKVGSSEGITVLIMGDDEGYFKYTLDD